MSEPKPEVGHAVYLRHNLGDVNPETKVSVTVPAGTPGVLVGYETRTQNYPDGKSFSWYYARVRIPRSPGQKELTTEVKEFANLWTIYPPKEPPYLNAWDRVGDDDFLGGP